MAVEMTYILNSTQIVPDNADDIGIKMDWSNPANSIENELTVDSVKLSRKAKKIVLDHIDNVGIFQGIPLTIQIENVSLEYYIDLVASPKLSGEGDSSIEVKIKKRKSFTWFKDNADVLSFEAINVKSAINTFNVPYVVIRDNQAVMLITMTISTFAMVKTLAEGIERLAESVADLIEALGPTPSLGVGVGFAGPVVVASVGSDTGDISALVIKVIVRIILLAAILVAIINMAKRILDIIFPPVHNLKGSTFLELINKGCNHLGFTFQSSILSGVFAPLAVLPVPLIDGNQSIWDTAFFSAFQTSFNKGYPTAQDTTPTLGSLIDAFADMVNGEIWVENNIVRLERRDHRLNVSARKVTNTLNLQDVRENQYTYNTGEAFKRYYLHYQTDISDTHTLDNMTGISAEYSTEPVSVVSDDLVNIKGLFDVSIPFSFGSRKKGLNIIEKAVLPFAKITDTVTGVFGGGTSFVSKINGRVGVLQISQPLFTTTKILYQFGGKQPADYIDKIKANRLYLDYHFINEVKFNFKRIYSASVPFSSKDFAALQNNNYILDETNTLLELLNFEWVNKNKTAEIEYAVDAQSENTNVKTVKING